MNNTNPTITVVPYNTLGKAEFGWLSARHHFSFGHYHNPAKMGFGTLRVVNDDKISAGTGFDPHPHKDMEIITYVRKGEIRHKDNLGNEGTTPAGSVQVMSAGSGITHAEYASETETTTLYQIWIHPRQKGVTPRWDMAEFPQKPVTNQLPLLVSGHEADQQHGALFIHADATLHGGKLAQGTTITQAFGPKAYVLVSSGEITLNGHSLAGGDAAQVESPSASAGQGAPHLQITATEDAEVVVIGLPA